MVDDHPLPSDREPELTVAAKPAVAGTPEKA
jgi:hypothetical protein